MTFTYRVLAVASLAFFSAFASAQVAFNDFGTAHGGFDYNAGNGWTVAGGNSGASSSPIVTAQQFTSLASGVVADVMLPLLLYQGSSDTLQVRLVNDNGGAVGSTVLESWTMAPTGAFSTWTQPTTLTGDGSALLSASTSYWLIASVVNQGTNMWAAWNWNNIGDTTGLLAQQYSGGSSWTYYSNQTTSAFRIDVTAAPEPATMIGLGIGAVALLRRRLNAKKS